MGKDKGRQKAPSYRGYSPSSKTASRTLARVGSTSTIAEVTLARFLAAQRIGFRRNVSAVVGKPDFLFPRARLAVFCDGDFWHGRHWRRRRAKLARGHNASYWLMKIRANMSRDHRTKGLLEADGWTVLRFWETDILRDPKNVGGKIVRALTHGVRPKKRRRRTSQ